MNSETPPAEENEKSKTPLANDNEFSDVNNRTNVVKAVLSASNVSYDTVNLDQEPLNSWNPEPPPELMDRDLRDDMIGDTVYSKRWVFSVLIKLIKLFSEQADGGETILEVDDILEKELCELWDICVNSAVAELFTQFDAVRLFVYAIETSRYPRVTEIVFGILANISCFINISDDNLINVVTSYFSKCDDAPTLTELMRLIHSLLTKHPSTIIERIPCEPIWYILQYSLCQPLLTNTVLVVYQLLQMDDCPRIWFTVSTIEALITAIYSLSYMNPSGYSHVFSAFTFFEQCVLEQCKEKLTSLILFALKKVLSDREYYLDIQDSVLSFLFICAQRSWFEAIEFTKMFPTLLEMKPPPDILNDLWFLLVLERPEVFRSVSVPVKIEIKRQLTAKLEKQLGLCE